MAPEGLAFETCSALVRQARLADAGKVHMYSVTAAQTVCSTRGGRRPTGTLGWHWGFPQDLFALNHYNPESIYIFFEAFGSPFPLE